MRLVRYLHVTDVVVLGFRISLDTSISFAPEEICQCGHSVQSSQVVEELSRGICPRESFASAKFQPDKC